MSQTRLSFRPLAPLSLVLLALAACTELPPAPSPANEQQETQTASWSVSTTPERCIARASGGSAASLLVTALREGGVAFSFSNTLHPMIPRPPGLPVTLRFTGAAGAWDIPAALEAPRVIDTELPLNDVTLEKVQQLLAGGTLGAEGHARGLPPLTMRPAGADGEAWLACARAFAGLRS
jgi:hypothetical protein